MFDDMIVDMISNKKFHPVVGELFIRSRVMKTSSVFIIQIYFKVPKVITLNTIHCYIMNLPNKR